MANVIDYVKWRGDISFGESPLNAIDALIFSELSYLHFDNFVPPSLTGKGVPLSILSEKFFANHVDKSSVGAILPTEKMLELLKLCAKSRRFSHAHVKGFINEIDIKEQKQFSAMCFDVGKNTTVVAFRGTDDTLIGWKEDLNMAFFTPIPSQSHSVDYLSKVISSTDKENFVVCGHSKGGNLAVYSALKLAKELKERVTVVYDFDGPGFKADFAENAKNDKILSRIYKFSPENTLIGAIFNSVGTCKFVKSTVKGFTQHDAFTWEVMGREFVYVKRQSNASVDFHNTLERLVDNMTDRERVQFVDALYKFMTVNDATTLTDVASDKLKFIVGILKTDMKTKKTVFDFMNRVIKEKYFNKSNGVKN